MAISDVFQVKLVTRYKTLSYLNNIFFYQQIAGSSPGAANVTNAFLEDVAGLIRLIMTSDITFDRIETVNLFNKAEIYTYGYPAGSVGTRPGTAEPPFVSVGYVFNRSRADMRNGGKRFSGIAETDIEDGSILPTQLAPFQNLEAVLNDVITYSVNPASQFKPIVVKRIETVLPGGGKSYRLPESLTELVSYDVNEVTLKSDVTSQISRKTGRGI